MYYKIYIISHCISFVYFIVSMSSIFGNTEIISVKEHDNECRNPTEFVRPAMPTYLSSCKRISNSDKESSNAVIKDKVQSSNNTNMWLSKITKRKIDSDRAMTKRMKLQTAILEAEIKVKVGMYVFTRHKLISPLSKNVKKKRRSRSRIYGTIVKRSEF